MVIIFTIVFEYSISFLCLNEFTDTFDCCRSVKQVNEENVMNVLNVNYFLFFRCESVVVCSTSVLLIPLVGRQAERFLEPVTKSSSVSFSCLVDCYVGKLLMLIRSSALVLLPVCSFTFFCVACQKFVDGKSSI